MSILIKSGLLLSIILFGFFMLTTGMVLSENKQLPGWLGSIKTLMGVPSVDKDALALLQSKNTAQEKAKAAASMTKKKPASEKKEPSFPLTAFDLPRIPSDKIKYALQIGLFPEKDQASAPLSRLEKAHLKPQWFSVVDSQQTSWHLLSTGNYKTPSLARDHLYHLLNRYNLPSRVIQLPAPKKKKK